ncbi:hypothetical protein [Streptomyces rochei]|uniref:hypothetical protein n=1 Tax=Streptomyces rochei TaxID=1928 RepID=UPI0013B90757|nr:hypothetical protein [Streptomyces rochei]NEC72942.1 hypothetical protein [Streptomyces rochei]
MISPLAMTAKKVIEAAWLNGPTYDMAVQAAEALESAQLLQSPETAAELARLRADQAANDREYEAATARIAELEAKLTEAERASETNFWWYVGQKDRADAAREDAVAALTEAAELSPEHAEALYERARSIAKAPTWPDHDQLRKSSRTPADATPDAAREERLAQLLDTIRTHRGEWRAGDVVTLRRLTGGPITKGFARRDLAELHRRGHLNQHGPADRRFYTLKRKRTRGGEEK